MAIEFGSYTHTGAVREKNEDNYFVGDNYAVVADGMGGHLKGEVASKLAVCAFEEIFSEGEVQQAETLLKKSVTQANKKIFSMASEKTEMQGMGTTVVSAAWNDSMVFVANVGDSRCYLIRNKEIKQISIDHSYVQHLVSKGEITQEEAKNRNDKNLILKAVGCEKEVEPDIFKLERKKGDIIVLCSDGLTNMVEDNEIKNCLLERSVMQKKVEKLVAVANKNGGTDNITLVAIKFAD